MRKKRTAITFDEITLEDKPSDLHPNDVSLKSFVTRKIALKIHPQPFEDRASPLPTLRVCN
jgi:IMP dehydrogenase/GMP reductase